MSEVKNTLYYPQTLGKSCGYCQAKIIADTNQPLLKEYDIIHYTCLGCRARYKIKISNEPKIIDCTMSITCEK